MTLNIYDMKSKFHGDRLVLTDEGLLDTYPEGTGTDLQYNELTASFEAWVSGTKYVLSELANINELVETITDIDAEMETVDLIANNDILVRGTVEQLFLKTGISNASLEIHKQTDFFTEESDTILDTINLYNDTNEINSGVTTAIFGGSRSGMIHGDIPIGGGNTKGFALQLKATNEANINAMRIIMVDNQKGGER